MIRLTMKFSAFVSLVVWIAAGPSRADEICCRWCNGEIALPQGVDLPAGPKFAPERVVDVQHIKLEITPDFDKRTIEGTVTLQARPIFKPIQTLNLDAVELEVSSVRCDIAAIRSFVSLNRRLQINFDQPIASGQDFELEITYRAKPKIGLYFRTPAGGYAEGNAHLWTQGEAHESPHWYPCFDYPNERSTSEVICTAPQAMTVLSNGELVSDMPTGPGSHRVHWHQRQPHVNYLISLVVGQFQQIKNDYRELPVNFYVPPRYAPLAANTFDGTVDMLRFFEDEIRVAYPWAKYSQVAVEDFIAGGMENTSLTTLTVNTLHPSSTGRLKSSRDLVAHELAHQWFGDLVTCQDWSHLWLNEGFATYYAALYAGQAEGRDALLYEMYLDAAGITSRTDDNRPIVYRDYSNAMEQFDYRSYPKGGWVLHMLRGELGEDVYRRAIETYLNRHRGRSVVTEDLRQTIEEVSGRPLERFFDQWLYHGGVPRLSIRHEWLPDERMVKLNIKQTQKVDDDVRLFRLPASVRVYSKAGGIDHAIAIDQPEEDFYLPCDEPPTSLRFDPEYKLLTAVEWDKPWDMVKQDLARREDIIGQILACESIKADRHTDTVEVLLALLTDDQFHGVQQAAIAALKRIGTPAAYDGLRDRYAGISDERARRAAASTIAGRYDEQTPEIVASLLKGEQNPVVRAAFIKPLGMFSTPTARKLILEALAVEDDWSYQTAAAVDAIGQSSDAELLGPLLVAIVERGDRWNGGVLPSALRNAAVLAARVLQGDAAAVAIRPYLTHPRRRYQEAAIAAIGELGERRWIAVLESLPTEDDSTDDAVRRAIQKLGQEVRGGAEADALREDVRSLREELEKLQKIVKDVQALQNANATED